MKKKKRKKVNWHRAAVNAIRIALRDYLEDLEFWEEYPLSKGAHRVDLLVVHKKTDKTIPKQISSHYKKYNIYEIKGIGDSLTIEAYSKVIGYAGLLINEMRKRNRCTFEDVTLNFISRSYPRKLFQYLKKDHEKTIAKIAPGIYDVKGESFSVRFLVTQELDPEEYLWLSSLTNRLSDAERINRLYNDYKMHSEEEAYQECLNELAYANAKKGGKSPMVLEGILELCGTSSEEIRKEADEYYQPLLKAKDKLLLEKDDLLLEQSDLLLEKDDLIAQLQAEIAKLKKNQKDDQSQEDNQSPKDDQNQKDDQ